MPDSLFDLVPRGDPDGRPQDYAAPSARFARPTVIRGGASTAWEPWRQDRRGKLFLGLIDGVPRQDERGEPYMAGGQAVGVDDNRHIITFAGSRAGKGRAVIVPNMLHWAGSVMATDPKGELAAMTARRRVELGQAVHVLDPFGVARGYPHAAGLVTGFNPIAAMRDGALIEDAALIADALVMVGKNDPHWDESARTFIEGVLLHVRTWPDYADRRNLLTLRDLVGRGAGDPSERGKARGGFSMPALDSDMRRNDAAAGAVQAAASDFFDRPEREQGSVLSTARRHLKFIGLFSETDLGRRTLEQDGFRLADLKTKPTTIYLCLPARHMGTCNRWLRLFVNLMLQSMELTAVSEAMRDKPAVLCVLDEFASLGTMKQIEDAAGQIAGFGVRLWPVLQDMGQLKALYESRWETFLGNAGVLQFFGNNDLTTLEWIAKRCGKTTIRVRSDRALTVGQIHEGAGQGWASELHDLLGVHEAAALFGRDDPQLRQLVLWGGHPPFVLQRAYYDKHPLFRDRAGRPLYDPPPAHAAAHAAAPVGKEAAA